MLTAALTVASLVMVASDKMELPIQSDGPSYLVFRSEGLATENSKVWARMQAGSVDEWCASHRPEADRGECINTHLEDKLYHAAANCKTGLLTDIDGSTYQYLGTERDNELWFGYTTFTDESGDKVPVSYAGGGIGIAALWWTLCPNGTPYDIQPLKAKLEAADYSGDTTRGVLDGQPVVVDYGNGRIIDPFGNVLFRGTIIRKGPIAGFFYKRSEGCPPVAYVMEGYENVGLDRQPILTLRGALPVMDRCAVIGKQEDFQVTVSLE